METPGPRRDPDRMGHPRDTAHRLLGALAAVLALALVTTSCSSTESAPAQEEPAPVAAAVTITTDELVASLADAGIATYADAAADAPEQPVEGTTTGSLTRWQAENMTRQVTAGRGYVGRDLDALVGTEVPISIVLAAYVKAADTPGAVLARELMGERDWAHSARDIVYPDVVVTLFVHDLAADGAGPESGAGPAVHGGGLVVQPAASYAGGLCSDLSDFLSSSLDSIVEALKVDASGGGVGGVLASIWNTVVDLAASAAQTVVEVLTAPVVAAIQGAVTVLAVLSAASSVVDPWDVSVTADTDPTSYGVVPAPGKEVTVTAHVSSSLDFTWPKDLVDCAGVAGVTLPDPGSPKGSPVAWQVQHPGVVTVGEQDKVVDAGGDARLHLTTLTESQEDHDHGELIVSYVGVRADITRTAVKELMKLVTNLLVDKLPAAAQGVVLGLLGPLTSPVTAKLEQLVQASGKMTDLEVQHHGPAPEQETPVPSTSATECAVTSGLDGLPDGTFTGPIDLDVNGAVPSSGVSVDSSGSGEMTIVVEEGEVTGGPWSLSWSSEGGGKDKDVTVHVELDGTIQGQVKGSAEAPVAAGHWSVHGTARATAMGVTQDVPIDEAGNDATQLTLESTTCDDVTATFVPSFNAKTGGVAVISGVARWTGTRVE